MGAVRWEERASELPTPEYVREEAVIIQPPYTMAPSRFELVHILQPPAEAEVAHKDAEDKGAFVGWVGVDDAEEREGAEEEEKCGFMAGAIVETTEATKRFEEVGFEEAKGGSVGGSKECA